MQNFQWEGIRPEIDLISPAFSENNIAICLFCSNEYVPYCGTLVKSIQSHCGDHNYDILILHRNITPENQRIFSRMIRSGDQISIRFVDLKRWIFEIDVPTHSHFTLDGCLKLFLLSPIFENYSKIIALDSDLIMLRDPAELFSNDIGNYYMAAADDVIMQYLKIVKSHSPPGTGNLEAREYIRKYLKIQNTEKYFNTGVVLFNLAKCRADHKFEEVIQKLQEKPYWLIEQDVLNIVLGPGCLELDAKWNVLHGDGNSAAMLRKLPDSIRQKYASSRQDPYIIHFAGVQKPWLNPSIDFADYFYQYARISPWYETILYRLSMHAAEDALKKNKGKIRERFRTAFHRVVNFCFPNGSRRRAIGKRCYFKLRGWPTDDIT